MDNEMSKEDEEAFEKLVPTIQALVKTLAEREKLIERLMELERQDEPQH